MAGLVRPWLCKFSRSKERCIYTPLRLISTSPPKLASKPPTKPLRPDSEPRRVIEKGQNSLLASYYRGGTSRAIVFNRKDLPSDQREWEGIFRGVIGSPDGNGRQLDGLGGGVSSLSKVVVVGRAEKKGEIDVDVDYTFAAIGIRDGDVDFSANCGNMSSAVGPFAVDEGLVDVEKVLIPQDNGHEIVGDGGDEEGERLVKVRILNTNTGKILASTFPVVFTQKGWEAATEGDFEIDGVEGKTAKVGLSFENPGGSKTGKLLPTGNITDTFSGIKATCIDCGNPCVFVLASDLNVPGTILPNEAEAHPTLLPTLDKIRRQAAVYMGLCSTPDSAPGSIPKIAMISTPETHVLLSGKELGESEVDVVARAVSVGQPHRAVPITVAMAVAAAAELKGSVVEMCLKRKTTEVFRDDGIVVGHASGKISVGAEFSEEGEVRSVTILRTARRLMSGLVYWR